MKKLFIVLMALALLAGVSSSAFAAPAAVIGYGGGQGEGTLRSVTTINTSGAYTSTTLLAVPTATTPAVEPGKVWILGYEINCISTQSEGIAAILDYLTLNTGNEDNFIMGESEASVTVPVFKFYPQGMELTRGLTIRQGPNTSVTVYYVKKTP